MIPEPYEESEPLKLNDDREMWCWIAVYAANAIELQAEDCSAEADEAVLELRKRLP